MFAKSVSAWVVLLCVAVLPAHAQQGEGTSDVISLDIQPAQTQQTVQRTNFEKAVVTGGVFFQNPSGEDQLDAGGEAELKVTLSNQGTGTARGLEITVHSSSSVEGLKMGRDRHSVSTDTQSVETVGTLAASEAKELRIPIYASETLPEENIELAVDIKAESGRVVGSTEKVTIPTGDVTTAPLVDREIPEGTIDRSNAVAVVIGVSKYTSESIPAVDYAVRDAETVKQYLVKTMGFKLENVIYLENPTQSDLNAVLGSDKNHKGRLYDYLPKDADDSEIFVYYSGHGAPNPSEDGRTYFLPADGSPTQLSLTGYPVDRLYENLSKLTSGPVTVAIDACFSGQSEEGTLVKDASPALLSVENPMMSLDQGLVMTASKADQISSWYPEKRHGLFTYYFLKGLRGEADQDKDKNVTGKEMESYLSENISSRARRLYSRSQNPQVMGKAMDRVLVKLKE